MSPGHFGRKKGAALDQVLKRLFRVWRSDGAGLGGQATGQIGTSARAEFDWRPALWSDARPPAATRTDGLRFDDEVSLFYDCGAQVVTARQLPAEAAGGARFILRGEVGTFSGSYLSLALSLSTARVRMTAHTHILVLAVDGDIRPLRGMTARLNLVKGPDHLRHLQPLCPRQVGGFVAEFDLAGLGVPDVRFDRIWLDLFLHDPAGTEFAIRDLKLSWLRRAEF